MGEHSMSPLLICQGHIKDVCDRLGLEPAVYEILKQPSRTMEFAIPIRMDSGGTEIFTGWCSQHDGVDGQHMGGITLHPAACSVGVVMMSMQMTLRCAALDLPYGGSYGAVRVNPMELSNSEFDRLSRAVLESVSPLGCGHDKAPAADQLYLAAASSCRAAVLAACRARGIDISRAKVALQGFGKVGTRVATALGDLGARIVAVADSRGACIHNAGGLDPRDMTSHLHRGGTIGGYPGAQSLSQGSVMSVDCDLIVVAAGENSLGEPEAGDVRAQIVCEASEGAVTGAADELLHANGVMVVPAALAGSGSLILRHLGRVNGQAPFEWHEADVDKRIDPAVQTAFESAHAVHRARAVSLRSAILFCAVERLAAAMRKRGLV